MLPLYLALATLAFVYFAINHVLSIKKDKHEPIFVSSRIPWIGHVLQIFTKKRTSHYIASR